MSEAKHTPGPWAWDGRSRVDSLPFRKVSPHKITDDDGTERDYIEGMVAIPYGCGGPGTRDANALLLAAAPELLEALQEAIALADSNAERNLDGSAARTPECQAVYDKCAAAIAKATGCAPGICTCGPVRHWECNAGCKATGTIHG